jgi:excisionase family DNA binding protein
MGLLPKSPNFLTGAILCCIITTKGFVVISRILNNMAKEDLLENYADVSEVSKRLNIHPESVRRLIRQEKLPAIKFGNKWLVAKTDLDQFASRYDPRPGNKATLF